MRNIVLLVFVAFFASSYATCSSDDSAMKQILCGIGEELKVINFEECVADLSSAEADFVQGVTVMHSGITDHKKSEIEAGLKQFAQGLREAGDSVRTCDLDSIALKLATIAAKFGSAWGEITTVVKIMVEGVNIYDDVYDIIQDYHNKNFQHIGKVLIDLSNIIA